MRKRKKKTGLLLGLLILVMALQGTAFAAEEDPGGGAEAGSTAPPGRSGLVGETLGTAWVIGPEDAYAVMPLATEGSYCTITPGEEHAYDGWTTNKFWIRSDGGEHLGFCAQPNKATPSGVYQVSELDNDNIKVMLLCGYGGPFQDAFCPSLFGSNDWYAYTHAVIGYLYGGDMTGLSAGSRQGVMNIRNWTYGVLGLDSNAADLKNETVINAMDNYVLYVAYNDDQDIVWIEPKPEKPVYGQIELTKTGTHTGSAAAVEGAVYGIYADAGCQNRIGTITTGADGKGMSGDLEAGTTCYVKEISAPAGATLDPAVYPISVTEGVSTLAVKDTEWAGEIRITKTDGSGTLLSGAVFGLYEWSAPAGAYVKTGTLTDLGNGSYESGTLYYSRTNLGKFQVIEEAAPAGYCLSDWKQEIALTESGETVLSFAVENEPTRYRFLKTDSAGSALAGCRFELRDAAGQLVETWTTGETGIHEVEGKLAVGKTYTLREIDAPVGYLLAEEQSFVVSETSDWVTVTTADGEKTGTIRVHKQDGDGQPCKGAVFSLYTTAEIPGAETFAYEGVTYYQAAEMETDESGSIRFSGLDAVHGNSYLLIEGKAPEGKERLGKPFWLGTLPVVQAEAPEGPDAGSWKEKDGLYYLFERDITVTDGSRFVLPMTGEAAGPARCLVWMGAWALAVCALFIQRKRKKRKGV